ncbi:MAG TPA: hypothetical protein VJP85_15555 [Candidatus Baltobacteraceae bacterium]|nr:hypothetical protein [Candidatus Baltobacteraceae bacterium]
MTIAGKPLYHVHRALYEETRNALLQRAITTAGAVLSEAEAQHVARKLANARIAKKCGCGQEDCNTYYFETPAKAEGSVTFLTLRFHSRGEHVLHIDSDGDVYRIERLYDLP